MRFTKMQGAGNDYIYINGFEEKTEDPAQLAVRMSDRHFGVGADGLILIAPSEKADCRMEMYNADGSVGAMCGNGIRCVAHFVRTHGLSGNDPLRIETASGIRTVYAHDSHYVVEMGFAHILRAEKPDTSQIEGVWDTVRVDIGNPHYVIFVQDLKQVNVERFGPALETDPVFPDRSNIEFVQILNPRSILLRVWERGSGETMACGTGTCAAVAAGLSLKKLQGHVNVSCKGGKLQAWQGADGQMWLSGPAEEVFTGQWD